MRKLFVLTIVLLVISSTLHAQDAQAWEILTLVNRARNDLGISGLLMSIELVQAAQRHSDDMALEDFLGHQGSDGSWPAGRVSAAGYNWIQVGENVLYRFDLNAQAAFDQWWNSSGHRENMLNPDYVEIGIAWARSASGKYYYTMVLAARLEVGTPVPGQREGLVPSPTLDPQGSSTPTLALTLATNTPTPPMRTLFPSATPIGFASSPTPNVIVVTAEPTTTPAPATAVALAPTVPFSTLAPPTPIPSDLRLVYDETSFALINISARMLDLTGLSFQRAASILAIERWNTQFLTTSLAAFPPADCLQAWDMNITSLPKPSACRTRHAWIAVNGSAQFWRDDTPGAVFTVNRPEGVIAVCEIWRGECDVSLSAVPRPVQPVSGGNGAAPASTNTALPQAQPPASSGGAVGPDLTILYSQEGAAVINTSGRQLDLTGISFSGTDGVLNISAWDNGFLTAPLSVFPPNDCLQVWDVNASQQTVPNICETRHAWVAVNDSGDFWRGTFSVARSGVVLATCQANAGRCEVMLP